MTSSFILSSSFILHTNPHPRWQAHPSSPHLLSFILLLILYLFILLLILDDKLLHPLLIFYPHPGWQAHPFFSFIPHTPPHPLSFILILILDDKLNHPIFILYPPYSSSSFILHTPSNPWWQTYPSKLPKTSVLTFKWSVYVVLCDLHFPLLRFIKSGYRRFSV